MYTSYDSVCPSPHGTRATSHWHIKVVEIKNGMNDHGDQMPYGAEIRPGLTETQLRGRSISKTTPRLFLKLINVGVFS